ncbi:hypothetical protein DVH24_033010 [Malus domestica]|uniref:Uncharacterized protein n=1 Tax=Malus domestica TaxID=3750 RepID=A0A498IMY5_MALDO|nr:hypothetical protein DVH24_033010 [Malus domestica]
MGSMIALQFFIQDVLSTYSSSISYKTPAKVVNLKLNYSESWCSSQHGFVTGSSMFMITDSVPFSDIESQTVHVGKEEVSHCFRTFSSLLRSMFSIFRFAVHLLVTSFLFRDSASLGSQGQRTMTPARSSNIWKMMMLSIGCMDNLYGSVENLDLQHFRTAECRDMLLHPRSRAEDLLMNLKLKCDQFKPSRLNGFADWNTVEELTFDVGADEVEDKMYNEEQKIPIKLIVSKSKTKVCYAEAGVDFVNLIFSFLTLPLGFIVKQMQNNSMKGSNDRLYRGVRDLDEQYLKSYLHKKMFPSPELPPKYGYQNHPLGIEESSYEDISGVPAKVIDFVDPKSHDNEDIKACGFMKGLEMFMVTDNLNVSPISAMLGMSILRELDVPVTDIEVRVAHVSAEEAFRLLVASFVCNAALTSAFLAKPKRDGELGYLGFLI